jgi:hypothetical protein
MTRRDVLKLAPFLLLTGVTCHVSSAQSPTHSYRALDVGGEVVHNIALHGASRVARAVIISSVPSPDSSMRCERAGRRSLQLRRPAVCECRQLTTWSQLPSG